ncbi:hypothetical protein ACIXO6_11325 [Bacteroides fragilis]
MNVQERKRKYDLREIWNAIFYVVKSSIREYVTDFETKILMEKHRLIYGRLTPDALKPDTWQRGNQYRFGNRYRHHCRHSHRRALDA